MRFWKLQHLGAVFISLNWCGLKTGSNGTQRVDNCHAHNGPICVTGWHPSLRTNLAPVLLRFGETHGTKTSGASSSESLSTCVGPLTELDSTSLSHDLRKARNRSVRRDLVVGPGCDASPTQILNWHFSSPWMEAFQLQLLVATVVRPDTVRYTFIQIAKKTHPKTLASKNTFIQKHFLNTKTPKHQNT